MRSPTLRLTRAKPPWSRTGQGGTHCAAAVRIRDEAQGDPAAVARANHDEAADTERLCHRAEHGAGLLRGSADVGQGPGRNEPGAVAHAGVVEPDVRKPALDKTLGQMGAHRDRRSGCGVPCPGARSTPRGLPSAGTVKTDAT